MRLEDRKPPVLRVRDHIAGTHLIALANHQGGEKGYSVSGSTCKCL
jgi:hypothetical protein